MHLVILVCVYVVRGSLQNIRTTLPRKKETNQKMDFIHLHLLMVYFPTFHYIKKYQGILLYGAILALIYRNFQFALRVKLFGFLKIQTIEHA